MRDLIEKLRGLTEAKKKPAPAPTEPEEMLTRFLRFGECEHGGDLDSYVSDLTKCGASIVDTRINDEAETCVVKFTVPKSRWDEFWREFQKTDAYGFRE